MSAACSIADLGVRLLPALSDVAARQLRHEVIFRACKWDPQVEDVATIDSRAVVLTPVTWRRLAMDAEALAAELQAQEAALLHRPELWRELGLPWSLRLALAHGRATGEPVAAASVMRFDFHPTSDGWRISEVNRDVPGGFGEAGVFADLLAKHHPGSLIAGDPALALAAAVARRAGSDPVALVHCTSYSDDRQVMELLACRLRELGVTIRPVAPDGLRWDGPRASFADQTPVGAIIRFTPAEWLSACPWRSRWWRFFGGGGTPAANPAAVVLSQSKRLPLLWDRLGVPCPTWRRLLPETREPRTVDPEDPAWIHKPAWGRVGDGITGPGFGEPRHRLTILRQVRRHPRHWLAQRRFASVPLDLAAHLCLGIFVIDGRAIGAYARMSETPPIDHRAREAAVLIADTASTRGIAA